MPPCGCPDIMLADGEVRKCSCQPCSDGNMNDCICNKETGCACSQSQSTCVCGSACSCVGCACQVKPSQQPQSGKTCCGQKKEVV